MNSHELKALQVRITAAKSEAESLLESAKVANQQASKAQERLKQLQSQLSAAMEAMKEPVVTEHALLRYIERVYNINLDDVRKSILTPAAIKAIKVIGSGKFPLEAGGRAVVKGNAIISITD